MVTLVPPAIAVDRHLALTGEGGPAHDVQAEAGRAAVARAATQGPVGSPMPGPASSTRSPDRALAARHRDLERRALRV
jgi:hypothetical protein